MELCWRRFRVPDSWRCASISGRGRVRLVAAPCVSPGRVEGSSPSVRQTYYGTRSTCQVVIFARRCLAGCARSSGVPGSAPVRRACRAGGPPSARPAVGQGYPRLGPPSARQPYVIPATLADGGIRSCPSSCTARRCHHVPTRLPPRAARLFGVGGLLLACRGGWHRRYPVS